MGITSFYYDVGDIIRLRGREYSIKGKVTFQDRERNESWTEYYLDETTSDLTIWLMVNNIREKFLFYVGDGFWTEERRGLLEHTGYIKTEEGCAEVIEQEGQVYLGLGRVCTYTVYEHSESGRVELIQDWGMNQDISKGMYIHPMEIMRIDMADVAVYAGNYEGIAYRDEEKNRAPLIGTHQERSAIERELRKSSIIWNIVVIAVILVLMYFLEG
ncbi:MAG: DUF4178 domain-containing protein [Cellulosilyticaceae bacterium]